MVSAVHLLKSVHEILAVSLGEFVCRYQMVIYNLENLHVL